MQSPFCLPRKTSLTSTQVRRAHECGHTDRMGSGCGGERQGQEIVDAANTAGTQSATPLGPANLAGSQSDSTMQQKWCRGPIERIYGSDSGHSRDGGNVTHQARRKKSGENSIGSLL